MNKLLLIIISILLLAILLLGAKYSFDSKINNQNIAPKIIDVELIYNNRTGELSPMFEKNIVPSTCTWTLQGERENDFIIVTRAGDDGSFYNYNENQDLVYFTYPRKDLGRYNKKTIPSDVSNGNFVGFTKYDWIGHTLSNGINIIKSMEFLPPRAPIYMTCVDYENNVYQGTIKEYE